VNYETLAATGGARARLGAGTRPRTSIPMSHER